MKIISMACLPLDIELACFGTLSKYVREKHEGHIVISKNKMDWPKKSLENLRESSQNIGISEIHFLAEFDYSAVTQRNVNSLSSIVRTVNPSLVIMPSWKALNRKRRILAKSALVACRGIGNILMYELDNNSDFIPSIYVLISKEIARKKSFSKLYDSNKRNKSKKIDNLFSSFAKNAKIKTTTPVEAFESHRILMVDDMIFS